MTRLRAESKSRGDSAAKESETLPPGARLVLTQLGVELTAAAGEFPWNQSSGIVVLVSGPGRVLSSRDFVLVLGLGFLLFIGHRSDASENPPWKRPTVSLALMLWPAWLVERSYFKNRDSSNDSLRLSIQ